MTTLTYKLPTFYGNNRAFYHSHEPECLIAGPADTGKTLTALAKIFALAWLHSNASLVIARKRLTDCFGSVIVTLEKQIMTDCLAPLGPVTKYGGEKPQFYDFPNGSRIWVAGLDKPGKILSAQHDVIYVNQAEEISLIDWETLITRTTGRAGHAQYSQTIGDCNPAHPGHWIIQRSRDGRLKRIDSTHRDNPELYDPRTGELTEQGEQRIGRLKTLTGSRRDRLYLGLWSIPEGSIYSVYEEERHKVKAFPIPMHWPRFVGIDPIGAYVGAIWVAYDPTERKFHIYREYLEPFGISTSQHAKNILTLSEGETIFWWVVGQPAERQARLDFQAAGIPAVAPAFSDVWAGIDRIIDAATNYELVIHDSCIYFLDGFVNYRRKMKDGEPTEAIEDKDRFHLNDAARYAFVGPERQQQTEWVYMPGRIM